MKNFYHLIRRFSFDAIVVTLGRVFSALGSLVTVFLLTKNLIPSDYGALNLVMTFSIAITQIMVGPLGAGSTRFYMASIENGDSEGYLKTVFRAIKWINFVTIFIGLLVAVYLFTDQESINERNWLYPVVLITLFSLFTSYNTVINGLFLAAKRQFAASLFQSLEPWVKLLFAIGFIYLIGSSTSAALFGYTIAIAIILFFQFRLVPSLIKADLEENDRVKEKKVDWLLHIKNYSMPFFLWGGFTSLHLISDRWSLQYFTDLENVGYYSVLYQIGYFPITLVIGILVQLATPYIYQKAGITFSGGRKKDIKEIGKQLILVSLLITVMLVVFFYFAHEVIFYYLISTEYSSVSYLLPYICLAAGLFATGQVATLILQSDINTKALLKPKILTSILGVILNIVGAYYFGVEGVVYALIIYGSIYLVWILIIAFKRD